MKNFLIGSTAFLWLMVIRLELTAKHKAETLYGHQMKEYEIMRTKWLEIASKKMDFEANKSIQPPEYEVKEIKKASKSKK